MAVITYTCFRVWLMFFRCRWRVVCSVVFYCTTICRTSNLLSMAGHSKSKITTDMAALHNNRYHHNEHNNTNKKSTIFAQIYYPSNLVFFRINPRNQSLVLFHFPKFGYKICERAQPRPNQVMNDEGITHKNGRVCPQCNQTRLLKFLIHNVPLASVRVFIIFMVWHRLKLDLMRAAFMHLGNIYDKPDLYNFRDFKIDQR